MKRIWIVAGLMAVLSCGAQSIWRNAALVSMSVSTPGGTPELGFGPSELDFVSLTNGAPVKSVWITNTGTGTLTGSATLQASSPFSITNEASYSLAAGAWTNLDVQFSTNSAGSFTNWMALSIGVASNAVVALSGTTTNGVATEVTYLIDENFEGTGTPTDFGTVGSVDYDVVSPTLQGSQCVSVGDGAYAYITLASTYAELYGKFMFRISALPASYTKFFKLANSGITEQMNITLLSDGKLTVNNGSTSTTETLSANTTYTVWWHYKSGTGSNAQVECWFSATGTKPANGSGFHTSRTGAEVDAINYVYPMSDGGITSYFDVWQIAETAF